MYNSVHIQPEQVDDAGQIQQLVCVCVCVCARASMLCTPLHMFLVVRLGVREREGGKITMG